MHAAKFLSALILGSALAAAPARLPQFEQRISQLEKKLAATKKLDARYKLFLAAHRDLSRIRNAKPRAVEADQLAMSLFLDTLQDFPAQKDFKPENCPEYVQNTKTMMGNRANEDGDDRMVIRAFKVAEAICRK